MLHAHKIISYFSFVIPLSIKSEEDPFVFIDTNAKDGECSHQEYKII